MKADHVLNAVRGTREGQMYARNSVNACTAPACMRGCCSNVSKTCRRLGLNERRHKLRTDLFKLPAMAVRPAGIVRLKICS